MVDRIPITKGATGAPYSPAVVAGELVFTAGQVGLDPATGKIADSFDKEARQALDYLKSVLEAAGSGLERALKVTVYVTDMSKFGALNEIYKGYFPADPPARTTVQVSALPFGAQVEVDAVALKR